MTDATFREPLLDDRPASEKDLLALMQAWRHGRATRHLWQLFQDGYIALLSVAMLGAMVVNLIYQTQKNAAACVAGSCLSARALLPAAMFAGVLTGALILARMFGPVLASAAEGFWLLDSPLRRNKLLAKRLVLAVLAAAGIGAVLGALVATLTGSAPLAIVAWALAAGLGAASVVAFAAAEQGAERTWTVRALQAVSAAAGVAALLAVVSISVGWLNFAADPQAGAKIALAAAGVAALVLLLSWLLAVQRLARIRRSRLTSGGALVSGMQGAMFALDFGLMRDILVEREAAERGHVKPTLGRGTGMEALVWRDVQRLLRFPRPLVGLLVSAVVPYAVAALGFAALNPFISGIVLCFMLVPFLGQMRVLSRTAGLARLFPMSTAQLRTASMVVPAILAGLWSAAVTPAFMGLGSSGAHKSPLSSLVVALLTGVAGLMGAVRWTTAKQVNFNTPMLATSAGALPPGLVMNLFRGFDMVGLITLPLIFNLSPWFSVAIAGIVFFALRGAFSQEELMRQQEEQKRLVAEQKALDEAKKANREKIKIKPR